MVRQRSLQNGNSGSELLTEFLQIGQRSLRVRLAIRCKRSTKSLKDPGHQVVIVCFDDFTPVELACPWGYSLRKLVHEYLAIDFRGVHCGAAFEQEVSLF